MDSNFQSFLSIIGAVGGVCGAWSLWYTWRQTKYSRRQTELLESQIAAAETAEKEDSEWATRFERLANRVSRINPGLTIQVPGTSSQMCLYPAIFSDPKFREALETYVIQVNASRTQFSPRSPRPDELRRTNLRSAVERAERCMAEFQEKNPKVNLAYYMADIGS